MAARPARSLIAPALVALCVLVAAAGTIWTGWDLIGPAHRPMIQGADDSFYYFWLSTVVIDHDLDFTNQVEQSQTLESTARDEALAQHRTPTGLLPNKYPPGWALGSLPFFLAAHATAPAGATGLEARYQIAVWLGQLLYAAIGFWLAIRIVARFVANETATIAVALTWLASPLVYYQSARLAMSHSQVFALAAAVMWLAFRVADGDDRRRTWTLLGLTSALMVVTRNVTVVYLLFPGCVIFGRLRTLRAGLCLALGAAGPAIVQLAVWRILYGSWLTYSYGDERFDFTHWHTLEVLFSPRHGWFYWHPFLLVAIAAFGLWAARRGEGRAWLGSLAAIVAINSAWPAWWLGSSFGNRGFEAATLFAMIGTAVLWEKTTGRPRWRGLLLASAGAAIAWNLALLALFLTHRIPRDEAVTYAEAARALARW